MTEEYAANDGLEVDQDAFNQALEEQRARAREARGGSGSHAGSDGNAA